MTIFLFDRIECKVDLIEENDIDVPLQDVDLLSIKITIVDLIKVLTLNTSFLGIINVGK